MSSDGERVIFDPRMMEQGKPYLFHFLGRWMAVRRMGHDDALEFLYFPEADDED